MYYILSQILVCLAYFCFAMTLVTKNRTKIMIFNFCATTSFCLSYLFLFAWSGVVSNLISMLRNVVFFLITKYTASSKNTKLYELLGFIFIVLIYAISSIFTYDGVLSLMPIIASICYTYGIWQTNNLVYKIITILNSVFFVIYNAYVNSIMGVVFESVIIVCGIIATIKQYGPRKKEEIKNGTC